MTVLKDSDIAILVESILQEELGNIKNELVIQEGFFQNIKKAVGFASKLAYLQTTKGPDAVKDELIVQLDTFVKKAKSSKMSYAMKDLLDELDDQVQEIKTTKQRARDARGRFSSGRLPSGVVTEAAVVGREYNHLEDLVFIDGSVGAMRAVQTLENLGQDSKTLSIKWDGNPTIYWGNDPETGEFVMVGKNGWGRNKSSNSEDLKSFITSSGKGEPWRQQFGSDMAQVFDILKSATSPSFVGFVFGDLLYYPGKPFEQNQDGSIVFTPNLVTYTVNTQSELGRRMAGSSVAVVAHTTYKNFGDKSGSPVSNVSQLNSKDVVVLGQTYTSHQPKVDTQTLQQIKGLVSSKGSAVDDFLQPLPGLSDMSAIMYTFVNQMSRGGNLTKISSDKFVDWIASPGSKISPNKQQKILFKLEENLDGLEAILQLVTDIMTAKNSIIDQLDSASADVVATTGGAAGGEGYVDTSSKLKLVPRHRWKPK